jgi:hypothetical protein
MNCMSRNWKRGAAGLLVLALTGCIAAGYGGSGIGVGYVGGFYEPGGYEYGGWGPGYRVGPPRGAREERGQRSAPSIPQRARRDGGHR